MLEEPRFAQRAAQVARILEHEDGVKAACDALESLYRRTR
jgi:UDP:flavonoid glycosyltransferase YjiC (YdhE family)